jgi:hypothetical protein
MDFAYMLKPLNDLTRKGQKFNWTTSGVKSCQHAFEAVKETIVEEPETALHRLRAANLRSHRCE